jgi:ATP-dependent helicase/DNAse subunit B
MKEAFIELLKIDQALPIEKIETEVAVAGSFATADDKKLFLAGRTDRIEERVPKSAHVRLVDFKSGKGKDRDEEPLLPGYDIQLLVYYFILMDMGRVSAANLEGLEFRYPENPQTPKREFVGSDLRQLVTRGEGWLGIAHELLRESFFVRTTDPENCKYCEFSAVCGRSAHRQADVKLQKNHEPTAKAVRALWQKGGSDDGEE